MAVKISKTKVKAEEPKAEVDVTKKTNGSELSHSYTEKVAGVVLNDTPHATVSFKAGTTKNLGDYNSARVDVMVTLPTEASEEGLEAAYNYAYEWVDQKMAEIDESMEGDD